MRMRELRSLFHEATQERLGESDRIMNAVEDLRKAVSVLSDHVDAIEPAKVDLTQEMADDIVRKIHGPLTISKEFSNWLAEQGKFHDLLYVFPIGYGPGAGRGEIRATAQGVLHLSLRDLNGADLWRGTFVPPGFGES